MKTSGKMLQCYILLILFFSSLAIPTGAQPPALLRGRWVDLPRLPTPRHDLQLVTFGGKIYAISGAGDLTTNVVEVFQPQTGKWLAPVAPIPDKRGWFGAALFDGEIYCIGGKRVRTAAEKKASGDDEQYQYLASVNIFDPGRNRWRIGKPLRDPDAGVKAAVLGGKIYVVGGHRYRDRVEIYDPKKDTWTAGPALPEGRMAPGLAAVGSRLYVFGGLGAKYEEADVFIFDPAVGRWARGTPMPTPRRDLATAVLAGQVWCLGGVNRDDGDYLRRDPYVGAVEIYDPLTDSWRTATALPGRGKAWFGATVIEGTVHIGGGARGRMTGGGFDWLDDMQAFLPDPAAGPPATVSNGGGGSRK